MLAQKRKHQALLLGAYPTFTVLCGGALLGTQLLLGCLHSAIANSPLASLFEGDRTCFAEGGVRFYVDFVFPLLLVLRDKGL